MYAHTQMHADSSSVWEVTVVSVSLNLRLAVAGRNYWLLSTTITATTASTTAATANHKSILEV